MLNAILYVLESNRFSAQGIESSGVYNCRKKKKKNPHIFWVAHRLSCMGVAQLDTTMVSIFTF